MGNCQRQRVNKETIRCSYFRQHRWCFRASWGQLSFMYLLADMSANFITISSIFLQNFFNIFQNNLQKFLELLLNFTHLGTDSAIISTAQWTIMESWKQHFAFIAAFVDNQLTYYSSNINAPSNILGITYVAKLL